MGTTFVTLDGTHGFWMRDGLLELWLRLLALHIPEPAGSDPRETSEAAYRIRNSWLLASKGYFTGCVPVGLDDAFATEAGRAVATQATRSLIAALQKCPGPLSKDTLNLLGFEGGEFLQDIEPGVLLSVGEGFEQLYAGKVMTTASDPDARVPK